MLSGCLQASSWKASREKMWSAYHALRISNEYKTEWNLFLALSDNAYSSIFCQYVGHYIFKEMIKKHDSKSEKPQPNEDDFIPTYEEENGIRYAAGWVARALEKKFLKSSHPLRDDLQLCLWMMEMKVQASKRSGWR